MKVFLIIILSSATFFVGAYIGQETSEPEVVTEVQYEVKYVERPDKIVEKIMEVEVIKEVPREIREFESLQELKQFLEDDDTNEILRLYPIKGTGGVISFTGPCDYYALNLQRRALEAGYLMSIEIIEKDNEPHMINSAIIGNEVYYIEPQTDEVWLWGYRQLVR
ncbi:hypothetical protein ES703_21236 [subsurface metagenome]